MVSPRLKAWPRKYLWQAPRGLVLKLTRNSQKRVATTISGKSVAIVGNAQSLLSHSYGDEIDAHDVVIRINKGFVVNPVAQGTRTDIATVTPEMTEDEIDQRFSPKMILFLIPKLRHLRMKRPHNLRKLAFYPLRYWMADRNHIGRRPSSGYMMVSYLLRLGVAREITLYGFDFGKTATYYNPEGYKTPHNFAREGEIIQGWEAEGKLRIVRS